MLLLPPLQAPARCVLAAARIRTADDRTKTVLGSGIDYRSDRSLIARSPSVGKPGKPVERLNSMLEIDTTLIAPINGAELSAAFVEFPVTLTPPNKALVAENGSMLPVKVT